MSAANSPNEGSVAAFRRKLLTAMMLVVSALTALGLYLAQRTVAANAARDLQHDFQTELSSVHKVQELRHAALTERCRELVSKPRIHAALEDNALDLLYPSAKDELRDLMEGDEPPADQAASSLHARFYRFLDEKGAVLPPANPKNVGALTAEAEGQIALNKLPDEQQLGYVSRANPTEESVDEVIAVPIFSSETGEVISALVVGFKPFEIIGKRSGPGLKSGIWAKGELHLPSLPKSIQLSLNREIATAISKSDSGQSNFTVRINGAPQLLFYKRLNPGSLFPPAYEVCVYPLAQSTAQLLWLQWQIGGAGALLLLGGFVASHFVARRFSKPVEQLAVDSEKNRAQRKQAEATLASTSEELERSTRYSADASHQLKSPVAVLRTGLETLLTRDDFKPEVYEELSGLLHQTRRLTGVIDDLLLLSRMDGGHLQIDSHAVNLGQLLDEWLDDLGALPDAPELKIEKNFPAQLYVAGERRYTSLIVQNLLENARKYNRPGGLMRVVARSESNEVVLTIANTGRAIALGAQQHIFERFHHTGNASGHGLGLNLARELTRLHGGELKLVCSHDDWTEFELRLRPSAAIVNGSDNVG